MQKGSWLFSVRAVVLVCASLSLAGYICSGEESESLVGGTGKAPPSPPASTIRQRAVLSEKCLPHCFSPDGGLLVTTRPPRSFSDNVGPICLWDASTGKKRFSLAEDWTAIAGIEFSPDGLLLAAKNKGHHLKLWDVKTGKERAELKLETRFGNYINTRFSPDGRFLIFQRYATGQDENDTLHFWDSQTKQVRGFIEGYFWAMAFSPDGNRFAIFHRKDHRQIVAVDLWEIRKSPFALNRLKRHAVELDAVAFAPALDCFASASSRPGKDNATEIKLWDISTGAVKTRAMHSDPETHVQSLSFSPDGRFLVAQCGGGTQLDWKSKTTIWDVKSELKVTKTYAAAPVVSPDGRWLVETDENGADLFDAATLRRRAAFRVAGDFDVFSHVVTTPKFTSHPTYTFSPDSRIVAMTGLWRRVGKRTSAVGRLWDATTAKEIAALSGCKQIEFGPESRTLASTDEGGIVRLWEIVH
jgi:WD40 repeat protein